MLSVLHVFCVKVLFKLIKQLKRPRANKNKNVRRMQWQRNLVCSLPVQMLAGLVLGVVIGAFVSSDLATTWFKPLGDLFIRLIRMVVVPLVFATLVAGAAGIADVSKLGRVAVKTIITFGVTTAIAVMFGLIFAGIIDPGIGLSLSTEGLKAANVQAPA